MIKRSDIRQEIGRTDVPVRIARTIVQVQVIRPNMRTVVTVTADKGVSGEAVHDSGEVTEAHVSAAEAREMKLEEMTVPMLKEHAAKNGIDLGGARNKPEIISAIYAAEAACAETEQ